MQRLQCVLVLGVVVFFVSSSESSSADQLNRTKSYGDDVIRGNETVLAAAADDDGDDDDDVIGSGAKDTTTMPNNRDDMSNEMDYDNGDDDMSNETELDDGDDGSMYLDNRIDETPTYVSPVEKFVKVLTGEAESGIGRFISGITKPIRNIVTSNPAGRAVRNGFGEVLNSIADRFKAIYPGTAWCGAGDVAKSKDDVGLFSMSDSCCRSHDRCKSNIIAGEADHNLRNNGIFTRSHCQCDANFYHCLKTVNSIVATNIGITYFNILRPQCFKLEYPAHCARYGSTRIRNNKCLDYEYDYTQNKTWQWFDSPDFL